MGIKLDWPWIDNYWSGVMDLWEFITLLSLLLYEMGKKRSSHPGRGVALLLTRVLIKSFPTCFPEDFSCISYQKSLRPIAKGGFPSGNTSPVIWQTQSLGIIKAHSSVLNAKSEKYKNLFLCMHESSLSEVGFFSNIGGKLALLFPLLSENSLALCQEGPSMG